jgi:hypothetical protein
VLVYWSTCLIYKWNIFLGFGRCNTYWDQRWGEIYFVNFIHKVIGYFSVLSMICRWQVDMQGSGASWLYIPYWYRVFMKFYCGMKLSSSCLMLYYLHFLFLDTWLGHWLIILFYFVLAVWVLGDMCKLVCLYEFTSNLIIFLVQNYKYCFSFVFLYYC